MATGPSSTSATGCAGGGPKQTTSRPGRASSAPRRPRVAATRPTSSSTRPQWRHNAVSSWENWSAWWRGRGWWPGWSWACSTPASSCTWRTKRIIAMIMTSQTAAWKKCLRGEIFFDLLYKLWNKYSISFLHFSKPHNLNRIVMNLIIILLDFIC